MISAAGSAAAQSLQDCYNGVGIFSAQPPVPLDETFELSNIHGAGGSFDFYVVLLNPWNENTEESMAAVGGFEFQIVWPASWFIRRIASACPTGYTTVRSLAGTGKTFSDTSAMTPSMPLIMAMENSPQVKLMNSMLGAYTNMKGTRALPMESRKAVTPVFMGSAPPIPAPA